MIVPEKQHECNYKNKKYNKTNLCLFNNKRTSILTLCFDVNLRLVVELKLEYSFAVIHTPHQKGWTSSPFHIHI